MMSKVVLAVLALGLASTPCFAQGAWADKMITEAGAPLVWDFGRVPRGAQLYHRFDIKNIFAVPLNLNPRVGCHCVTVKTSHSVLQSKEDGYVDVYMDLTSFTGPRTVAIYLDVSAPNFNSSATLRVSANSRQDVVLNPGQISFGVISPGQATPQQNLDVEYAGALDWKITQLVDHKAPLDVKFKELYRQQGKVGYRVTVALKDNAPVGALRHEVYLKTNDPAGPLVPILVEGTVQANITVSPDKVTIGRLKVGESVTKLVGVRGSKPFQILGIDGQGEGVTAEWPAKPNLTQFIKVKCQPAKAGDIHLQLRIKTDLDLANPVSVLVDGSAEPPE